MRSRVMSHWPLVPGEQTLTNRIRNSYSASAIRSCYNCINMKTFMGSILFQCMLSRQLPVGGDAHAYSSIRVSALYPHAWTVLLSRARTPAASRHGCPLCALLGLDSRVCGPAGVRGSPRRRVATRCLVLSSIEKKGDIAILRSYMYSNTCGA